MPVPAVCQSFDYFRSIEGLASQIAVGPAGEPLSARSRQSLFIATVATSYNCRQTRRPWCSADVFSARRGKNKCGMRGVFLAWIKNVFLSTLATQKATLCPRKTGYFYKESQNTPVKRHHRVPRASFDGNIDFRSFEDSKSTCQVPGPFAASDPSPTATAKDSPRKEFVPGRQSH
jgi:hypothetical protein